ncbi:enoyl-CoA hydratase-related protein [Paraburkholderia sp. C35]|uniref:enoyl-CoA hydratase/isomerase family protein n=1 Tax=Paraburkholderia sp. C35 TaxID=2126993 RepID=UPI000D6A048B|nr:enoyl-CoA hydratase-related protein [Paraburkholderia sp. C35]
MNYSSIDLSVKAGIATITFTRPESYNSMDFVMAKELFDCAIRLTTDDQVRAIVLTGQGEHAFCAGGDVSAFAADPDSAQPLLREMTGYLHSAISRLAWGDAPVLAAVNGVAAGAGLSFVGACDLAFASEKATFVSAYTSIGLTPDASSTFYLPRIIGMRRTMELAITGRVLSAQEALDWGLVNRVTPADEVLKVTYAMAEKLAAGPTKAYGGVKRLLLQSFNEPLESQLERESREISAAADRVDGREGIRAFTEKRRPSFKGS